MKFIFLILNFLVISISFGQTAKSISENYEFLIDYADSLLKKEVEKSEYEYCRGTLVDSARIDVHPKMDSLSLLNKDWYIGEVRFSGCPLYCGLYKVNLQGSPDEEIVGILELPQPMGGALFIFVFDNQKNGYKFIGQLELSSFRNSCSMTFKNLLNNNCFEMVVTSDLYRSVYQTKGLRIFHLEGDSLYESFRVATYFQQEDTTEIRVVKFQDTDGDMKLEVIVESELVKTKWSQRGRKPLSRSTEIYVWGQENRKFELATENRTK